MLSLNIRGRSVLALLVFILIASSCEKENPNKPGAPSVNENTQVEFTIYHEYLEQGNVIDSLLPNADVKLFLDPDFSANGSQASRTGISNESGLVIFGNLPETIYTYEVKHELMQTQVQTISLATGNLSKYNIYLISN